MDALERVRIVKVLPFVRGRLLDLGCGFNNLVRLYGAGVGVDVYPWPGVNVLVGNSAFLPFPTGAFDTVTILAALNHIPNRHDVLLEVQRVLVDDGRLVLTMIGPLTGRIAHVLFAKDERTRDGLGEGERMGMTRQEVESLLRATGFVVQDSVPFELHLNRVYIAVKACRT
jgi:SAM-dependent methyltransferase